MNWKEFIADYLTFSRKDRLGIIVLLVLLGLIFMLQKITRSSKARAESDEQLSWLNSPKGQKFLDSLKAHSSYFLEKVQTRRSSFEPRYKKVPFYSYNRPKYKQSSFFDYKKDRNDGRTRNGDSMIRAGPALYQYSYHRSPTDEIDINDADSSMFISLPGIGSRLATRILKFREKLGGFYSIEQIGETFGLPDSTFRMIRKYLKLRDTTLRKININTAGEEELKSHPYIRWNLSNPIISYRNEHGPFQKLEDLKNVVAVSEEIYERIVPYLTIE